MSEWGTLPIMGVGFGICQDVPGMKNMKNYEVAMHKDFTAHLVTLTCFFFRTYYSKRLTQRSRVVYHIETICCVGYSGDGIQCSRMF